METNNQGPAKDPAYTNMRSMLDLLLTQREQAGVPLLLPPMSIHEVVEQIARSAGFALLSGQPAYVEPAYDLSAPALVFIQAELENKLGPDIIVTPYKHHQHQDHVIFQFKRRT